jgi:lysozyme
MNAHMRAGNECIRLVREFETGPKDGSVRLTSEGAALDAYWCGAAWTVSFGCTRYVDGTRVQKGDSISEDEVYPILSANLVTAEWAVKNCVKTPLTQHQFDALVAFTFNLGQGAFQNSTRFLPAINAGRFEDAASEFSAFVYSTTSYKGKPYQRALRGLLRRRLCEACVFLGCDWFEAVQEDRVALPVEREWQETKDRWRDRILTEGKTTFPQVFRTASMHPLPAPEDDFIFEANAPIPRGGSDEWHDEVDAITDPVRVSPDAETGEDMPPASVPLVREPPSSAPTRAAAPDKPAEPAPVPAVVMAPVGTKPIHPESKPASQVPYGIDPNAPLKPMEFTERFVGAAWMYVATWLKAGSKNVAMFTGPIGLGLVALMEFLNTPAGLAAASALTVMVICGVFYAFGWRLDKTGLRKKKQGEATSTQAMY